MHTTAPKSDTRFTRRQFLRGTTLSTAAFMAVPGAVLGLRGATSANRKLNIAGIGIGGQGAHDLSQMESENIVALCDVDMERAGHTFRKYPKAQQFTDYRQMLDQLKEIDGVVIATPDHHHAPAAMEAIKRGKHVYCEKPLTHSVWEARRLAQAAREAKVATQMGNQGQASEQTRRLCEYIWSGAIGRVHEAHIWTDRPSRGLFDEYWPQGCARPEDRPPVPATLNWDLWLGPAPFRPYHPAYLPFKWRGWWDFGTGALGDIGCHAMDPVFRALKLGAPLSVQAASTRVNQETFPLGSIVTYRFPARGATSQAINGHVTGLTGAPSGAVAMPPCTLVWYDGGLRPSRPDALPEGRALGDNGRLLIGEKGFILGNEVYPESCAREVHDLSKSIPRSKDHHQEWIQACKGGKPAGANFDWAGPLAESVLLGNVALRVQLREDLTLCSLLWDGANLRFTNLEDANLFLRREYRAGWSL
ncbi:MAG TPA: Gfo/Idh/MocA family oxidoreductase [Candidatus Paceibacterota bacterium]|nr:Gfo/Idh/MocA family oxidoreductase [Verrucomicrobiota bacterium]HSA12329.1 Gfo/Idh/MocA family oxidoreductase [Candidatus Paceibacterota bacterium]